MFSISTWDENAEIYPVFVCYKCPRALCYAQHGDRISARANQDHESAIWPPRLNWQKNIQGLAHVKYVMLS